MKTTIKQPAALAAFKLAESRYREEKISYHNKAKSLRHREEDERNALPMLKRVFTTLDLFTGFKEDLLAERAEEREAYCHKQIRILESLSPISRVCLCQKDLEMLERERV